MIIEIASEGGFAGIATTSTPKRIDVDEQSQQMQQDLCDAFEPDELERLATRPCTPCNDRLTYRITVTEADDRRHSFTLREDQLPPEILDLIDQF